MLYFLGLRSLGCNCYENLTNFKTFVLFERFNSINIFWFFHLPCPIQLHPESFPCKSTSFSLSTFSPTFADCPLDLRRSNITLAASLCSGNSDRGKCCRYINAFVALSIARYANATHNLGVPSDLSDICLNSISQTFELYGVPRNVTVFCAFGTKVPVNYECKGRKTVTEMLQSPNFVDVATNCKASLEEESNCRKCINAGILYLHNLVGAKNNITFTTCRDATFTAVASQVDDASAIDIASCFFGVQGLRISPGMNISTVKEC